MFSKLFVAGLLVSVAVIGAQVNPITISRTDRYLLGKLKNVAGSCAVSYEQYCKDEGLTKGMVPCLVSHSADVEQECLDSLKDYPLAYCFVEGQTHCQSLLPMTPSQLFFCLWSQVESLTDSECVAGLRHGDEEMGGSQPVHPVTATVAVETETVVVQTDTVDFGDVVVQTETASPDEVPATSAVVDDEDDEEDEDEDEETRPPRKHHGGDKRRPPRKDDDEDDQDEEDGDRRRSKDSGRKHKGGKHGRRRRDDDEEDDDEIAARDGERRRFHGRHPGPLHSVLAGAVVLFVGIGVVALVKKFVRRRQAAAFEGPYQNVAAASYA